MRLDFRKTGLFGRGAAAWSLTDDAILVHSKDYLCPVGTYPLSKVFYVSHGDDAVRVRGLLPSVYDSEAAFAAIALVVSKYGSSWATSIDALSQLRSSFGNDTYVLRLKPYGDFEGCSQAVAYIRENSSCKLLDMWVSRYLSKKSDG